MSRVARQPFLAALVASVALAGAARAGEVTTNLTGEVVSIIATGNPDAAAQLAALGAEVGSKVTAHVTVESTTPGVVIPFGFMEYALAVTDIAFVIGSWEAHIDPDSIFATVNFVQVGDNLEKGGFEFDSWSAVAQGLDTDNILSAGTPTTFGNFLLDFVQLPPNASSNDGLVQDLSKYKSSRLGTFGGPGGVVTVVFDGGGGVVTDPTAIARQLQLKAAAKLGRSVFKGLGKLAGKPPEADPFGAAKEKLIQDASDLFGIKFVAAVNKALEKGGTAPLGASDKEAATEFLVMGVEQQSDALTKGVDTANPDDRVLRSKLLKAVAAESKSDFTAHAKDAKKPDQDKLADKLAKSRAVLAKAVGKALDKAEAKGVVYDGPAADAISDALTTFVDGFVELTKNGVE